MALSRLGQIGCMACSFGSDGVPVVLLESFGPAISSISSGD